MVSRVAGYDVVYGLVSLEGSVRAVTERTRPVPAHVPMSARFAVADISAREPGSLDARTQWRPLAKTSSGALCAQSDPAPTIALFTAGSCP